MRIIGKALVKWRKKKLMPRKNMRKRGTVVLEHEKLILDRIENEEELILKLREKNRFNFYLSKNFLLALVMNTYKLKDLVMSDY